MSTSDPDVLGSVGVVVVTYQSGAHIDALLDSLPLTRLAGLVVVDNASTDSTRDLLARWQGKHVDPLLLPDNVGFGAGCNAGIARLPSAATAVLVLNPDARISTADIEQLATYLKARPAVGMVAPRLFQGPAPLPSAGEVASLGHELYYVLPPTLRWGLRDRRYPPTYDRAGAVGVVEGACMLIRRSAFESAGGFDPAYFLFFEEHELARRLAGLGLETHLCPSAVADHAVGGSRDQTSMRSMPAYFSSAIRYLRVWEGPGRARVFRLLAVLSWRLLLVRRKLEPAQYRAYVEAVRQAV
jgi:N-acetylglucosaminyl-diphospho-decaprenol L-rhamnosyltransferase